MYKMLVEADPNLAEAVTAAQTITSISVWAFLASQESIDQCGHLSRLWSAIDSAVLGVTLAASGRSTVHLAAHGAAAGESLSGASLSQSPKMSNSPVNSGLNLSAEERAAIAACLLQAQGQTSESQLADLTMAFDPAPLESSAGVSAASTPSA